MNLAVVGAGIFGVTVALRLEEDGHRVTLFDRQPRILSSASRVNQYRLHRGYHYPRSPETGDESALAVAKFVGVYGDAVLRDARHIYCIAKEGSLTTADKYLEFLHASHLSFKEVHLDLVNRDAVTMILEVEESRLDPVRLTEICASRLENSEVTLRLGAEVTESIMDECDVVVLCGYASTNSFLFPEHYESAQRYQFEVCEKPVVRLPDGFQNMSIVILDGPFMCVDPFGATDTFVLGHVEHAIHSSNIGILPYVPSHLSEFLDGEVWVDPPFSNWDRMIESGAHFIPGLAQARHVGSMFTVRAVLPGLEATDARPTVVTQLSDNLISVFAGKLATCVSASDEVARLLDYS